MPLRPTIADVARHAGVSKATAHRALTHGRRVSTEAMERVQQAAAVLDYRPDPALSMLARQRWQSNGPPRKLTLAVVSNMSPGAGSYPRALFEHTLYAAHAEGLDVATFNREDYPSGAALTRRIWLERIEGLLVPGLVRPESHLDLDWSPFAAVALSAGIYNPPLHAVRVNYFEAALSALHRMRAKGYRRIGCAFHREPVLALDDERRRAAWSTFCSTLPRAERAVPVLDSPFHDPASLLRWFKQHQPDAVLGFSAADYYNLRDAGVLGRAGFAALLLDEKTPTLSGVAPYWSPLATAAVRLVLSLLSHHDLGLPKVRQAIVIDPGWQEGETLPPKYAA